MSRSGKIEMPFGDGRHFFHMTWAAMEELQEKCDAGPQFVQFRLHTKQWKTCDVREPIRLGLIGGGMKPLEALAMVERYVEQRPHDVTENALLAEAIMRVGLFGVDEDPVGKPDGEAETASPPSPTESGDLLPSGEPQPPSGSPTPKS